MQDLELLTPDSIFELVIEKLEYIAKENKGSEIKYKGIIRDVKKSKTTVIRLISDMISDFFKNEDTSDSEKNSLKVPIISLQILVMVLSEFVNVVKTKTPKNNFE